MRSMLRQTAFAVLACVGLAQAVHASPFAYITNADYSNLSVIDTATNGVVATVPTGFHPIGVAVSRDGTRVYVSNSGDGTVTVIDAFTLNTITNVTLGSFPTGSFPNGIAVSPDGTRVYVAAGCCSVAVIDAATNTLQMLVPLNTGSFTESLEDLEVSPDGRRVYVTEVFNNQVSVVDTTQNPPVEIAVVPNAGNRNMAVSPAGDRVYVTNECNSDIEVIDTSTNTLTTPITSGFTPCDGPFGVTLNGAGTKLYVTGGGNQLQVFDTATGLPNGGSITVGSIPFGVQLTPDEHYAYVTSVGDNKVTVVDTTTNTVQTIISVGDEPHGEGHFIGPQFVCGNGILEPGEGCDDGNTISGDGCDADCLVRHDSVVVPKAPVTVTIPAGKTFRQVKVPVWVKNPDVTETAGHQVQLAASTDCPSTNVTIAGRPEFGQSSNVALIRGGKTATAHVLVNIFGGSGATPTFNRKAPTRCTLTVTATNPVLGTADSTPSNNVMTVELNLIDRNDAETTTATVHESVIKSMAPAKVTIATEKPSTTKTVHPAVVNADYLPVSEDAVLHSITVTRTGGTCPSGIASLVDFSASLAGAQESTPVAGGKTKTGASVLSVDRTTFNAATATSPQRCTVTYAAVGPTDPETAPLDPTNNTTTLTVDVYAK